MNYGSAKKRPQARNGSGIPNARVIFDVSNSYVKRRFCVGHVVLQEARRLTGCDADYPARLLALATAAQYPKIHKI